MLKKVALAVAAALAAQAVSAGAIDFHGYMRSSVGNSSEGGECPKFTNPGSGFPGAFRLGNECGDNYTELSFSTIVAKNDAGAKFTYHTRMSFGVPNRASSEKIDISNRENYIVADGLFGGAKLWAGKRFYRESDLHIRDYYYWNVSGAGAGVEAIDLGFGNLAVAWVKSQIDGESYQSANNFDVNLSDIKIAPNMQLQVRAAVAIGNPRDNDNTYQTNAANVRGKADNNGYGGFIALNTNLLKGFNKTVVQYFSGSMVSPNAAWYTGQNGVADNRANSSSNMFRVFDYIAIEPTANFAIHGLALWETAETQSDLVGGGLVTDFWGSAAGRKQDWLAIGVRPIYSLTDTFALQGEVGFESTELEDSNGVITKRDLTKVTFAPTFRPSKGAWARPEIRFFATYANWNEGKAGTGATFVDSSGVQQTDGMSYGVQVEAWW